jgi:ATP-binding cassette subfamily B protein
MGILFQEPIYYSASVAEDIAQGNLERPRETGAIKRAVEAAQAEELIARFPKGYATLLGEWFEEGTELSLGGWHWPALCSATRTS